NRRVTVAEFSTDELEDLFALRVVNEALAIRLTVPHLTSNDEQQLEESLRELDRCADARDVPSWEEQHLIFHRRLIKHARPRHRRLLAELADHTRRYNYLRLYAEDASSLHKAAPQHGEIVDQCLAQEPQGAAEALGRHIAGTAIAILAEVAPE